MSPFEGILTPACSMSVFDPCVCVCFSPSGGRDGDQPSGAGPDQDAGPPAVLRRAAGLHPLGGGPGRAAVPVAGPGAHRAPGRALLR